MRKRQLWASAAACCALTFGVVPAASADDPAQEKAEVEQQLTTVKGQVAEATAAVAAAAAALQAVDAQLAVAQASLAAAQTDLEAARAEDVRLAGELADALTAEDAAEAKLLQIQADIDHQHDVVSGLARSAYQGGQLSQVSALLEAQSFSDFTERSETMRSVLHAQDAVVNALADARAQDATTQAELEAVRERVAVARSDAAANLATKTQLERDAAAATAEVERLRADRATVLADAQASLAEDEAQYKALEADRSRLETLLAERAAAQAAAARGSVTSTDTSSGASSGVFYRPVNGWITSPYGMRVHPITGVYKLHDGTDFGAACGTPIRAAASGTVLSTSYSGGYGNQTVVEHGVINGSYVATSYNHQSSFGVSPGQHVDRGQVIGYVGTTGYSTGCHLHFMVYVNGSTTDPMNWL